MIPEWKYRAWLALQDMPDALDRLGIDHATMERLHRLCDDERSRFLSHDPTIVRRLAVNIPLAVMMTLVVEYLLALLR